VGRILRIVLPWTLSDVEAALRASWAADTCSPDDLDRAGWQPDNPAWGHCDITALLINDLFGGDLVVGEVYLDGVRHGCHWWNRLASGVEIDLTREQFRRGQVVTGARVVRRPAGRPARRYAEYRRLRDRVAARLGPLPASGVVASPPMTTWKEFTEQAPRTAGVFTRRHAATGNLCLLATLRSDGFPRISPMEPRIFEDQLWLVGMPGTTKFRDLARDPRFCLHTGTVDPHVSDGDAKLWGVVEDVRDEALHQRWAEDLFAQSGFDLRGQAFDQFFAADLTGASAVEVTGGNLDITIWKPGEPERVVRKH
jgi:hypothetical protein